MLAIPLNPFTLRECKAYKRRTLKAEVLLLGEGGLSMESLDL
jgi:hypothetical protein